jgi:hypothetical protein
MQCVWIFGLLALDAIRCCHIQSKETHNKKKLKLEELVAFGVKICFIRRGMV